MFSENTCILLNKKALEFIFAMSPSPWLCPNMKTTFPGIENIISLQWRHNGCDSVSNHQPHDILLNRLFSRRSKNTPKLRVTGLCAGEFTGDRWIPRPNGQSRGTCFHLMTSSCNVNFILVGCNHHTETTLWFQRNISEINTSYEFKMLVLKSHLQIYNVC